MTGMPPDHRVVQAQLITWGSSPRRRVTKGDTANVMGTDTRVLNPRLYRALQRAFINVRVSHAGEAMLAKVVIDPVDDERRYAIRHCGETYMVRCPFCRSDGKTL